MNIKFENNFTLKKSLKTSKINFKNNGLWNFRLASYEASLKVLVDFR